MALPFLKNPKFRVLTGKVTKTRAKEAYKVLEDDAATHEVLSALEKRVMLAACAGTLVAMAAWNGAQFVVRLVALYFEH